MLCGATGVPPTLAGWQAEPKWDGIRSIVTLDRGTFRMTSRLGNEITGAYPELAPLAARLAGRTVVLDGEVVALDEAGLPSFERLQRRMHVRSPSPELRAEVPVVIAMFDALWIDGEDLCGRPLPERRERLVELDVFDGCIRLCPILASDDAGVAGSDLLHECVDLGLEGFVAKRLESTYHPGRRSPAWLKAKGIRSRELVIGGWLPGRGSRSGRIGSLALGWVPPERLPLLPDGPALVYAGNAGSGLSDALIGELQPVMSRFATDTSPFTTRVPGVNYVLPVLVAEVQYGAVTASGTMRFPRLKGLRPDVRPEECGPGEGLGGVG